MKCAKPIKHRSCMTRVTKDRVGASGRGRGAKSKILTIIICKQVANNDRYFVYPLDILLLVNIRFKDSLRC